MAVKSRHVSVEHTKGNHGKIRNIVRGQCRNNLFLPVNLFVKGATRDISANMSKVTHGDSTLLQLERGLNEAQRSVYPSNGLFVYQKDTKNGCPPPFFRS